VANDETPFRLEITSAAYRDLKKLPIEIAGAIFMDLAQLKTNRHPPSSKKLTGQGDVYRLRTGDYRSMYVIGDGVVTVARVKHRREAYD